MEGKKYVEAAGGGCGWSHVSGGHDYSVRLLFSGPSQFSYASAGRVGVCGSCAHQAMDTNSGFGFLGRRGCLRNASYTVAWRELLT